MKQKQARRLIAMLKRRYWTVMDLHTATGAPTAWRQQISPFMRDHELIQRKRGPDGVMRYRVVAATRWTA